MSALCRLSRYHQQYQAISSRLARHIVTVAERYPLRPSRPLAEPADVHLARPSEVPFLAVVIAPDRDENPYGRAHLNGYFGTRAGQWCPFGDRPPVVDDVATAVHRLRMPIEIEEFVPGGARFDNCPGVLMIDPYVVATRSGPETVRAAVESLRHWVSVVIVADENAPGHIPRATALVDQVSQMFPSTANLSVFTNHDDWRIGIHNLVDRMRRRYLDERPAYPPKGAPPPRPRLFEGRPPPDERSDDQPGPGRTE